MSNSYDALSHPSLCACVFNPLGCVRRERGTRMSHSSCSVPALHLPVSVCWETLRYKTHTHKHTHPLTQNHLFFIQHFLRRVYFHSCQFSSLNNSNETECSQRELIQLPDFFKVKIWANHYLAACTV